MTGVSNHKWKLDPSYKSDRVRSFICERCGAGPVLKDIFSAKGSIVALAKKQGIASDCNLEITSQIMKE